MAPSSTITPLLPLFPRGCIYGCSHLAYKCASLVSAVPQTMRSSNVLDLPMTAQALLGQTYTSHTDLWASLDERREVLHHHLPSRALSHKPPLEAYPGAIHSGRSYRPEWEEELLSLEKVCTYLAQGRWFRGVRSNGYFGGGRYQYYLGKHFARASCRPSF